MTSDESERASKLLTEVAGLLSVGRGVRCRSPGHQVRQVDSIPEAGRWCERDCLGRHHPKTGGSHNGKTNRQESGSSHGSLPVRPENKAGCECVGHVLQTLTDTDPDATVMSMDGVGAYDLISV